MYPNKAAEIYENFFILLLLALSFHSKGNRAPNIGTPIELQRTCSKNAQ
jgi:hypothetical protein